MLVSRYVLCVFLVSLVTYTEIADTATFVYCCITLSFAGNDFPEDQRQPSVPLRQSDTTGFQVTLT